MQKPLPMTTPIPIQTGRRRSHTRSWNMQRASSQQPSRHEAAHEALAVPELPVSYLPTSQPLFTPHPAAADFEKVCFQSKLPHGQIVCWACVVGLLNTGCQCCTLSTPHAHVCRGLGRSRSGTKSSGHNSRRRTDRGMAASTPWPQFVHI